MASSFPDITARACVFSVCQTTEECVLPDLELRSVHIHTGSPLEFPPSPGGPTTTSHGAAAAHVFPEQTQSFSVCARFQSINPPDSCAWSPGLQPALYHVLECHLSRVQSSCPDCVDKPPGAQPEGLEPIQCSPLTRVPQDRAQALYGLMHSAAPGGGVCDHCFDYGRWQCVRFGFE